MPHIHTKHGQHDSTASAFIVRTDRSEPQLLLHMHKKLGKLLQVGGHIELDETPWQAITHEILEESGYQMDQLQVLQPEVRIGHLMGATIHPVPVCVNTHPFDNGAHFHTDQAYAFTTDQKPKHPVADGESSDLRWLTPNELRALGNNQIVENTRQVGMFVLEHALDQLEPVSTAQFS